MKSDVSTLDKDGVERLTNSDDIFDLRRLRLTHDFAGEFGVKKVITTIPVRKPTRQEWVYVHPQEDYRLQTCVLILKDERETYLVDPELWQELSTEIQPTVLLTCINRQNVLFLWPIRLPNGDGRHDHWSMSSMEAAKITGWIRIAANMSLGAYDVYKAAAEIPDPEWPDIPFEEIVRIAFKDNFVKDYEHPVIRRLQGKL
jgi:hypothetical protein